MADITLATYLTEKVGQTNAMNAISAKLDDPALLMADFALMVKALETMEYNHDSDSAVALKQKIIATATGFFPTASAGQDILMLSRAMKIGDIPFGGEGRWLLLNRDDQNLTLDGFTMLGERTFESFGDAILDAA